MNIVLLNDIFSVERKQNEKLGKWSFWSRYLGPYAVKQSIKNKCPNKSVAIIDYFLKTDDFFEYADGIIGEDTEFIGLSTTFLLNTNNKRVNDFNLWYEDHDDMVDWLRELKLLAPKAKIFVGGHSVDAWYKKYVLSTEKVELPPAMKLIDCFIHGYGESSVPNYINGTTNLLHMNYSDGVLFISDDVKAGDRKAECLRVKWDHNDYVRRNEWLPLEISKGCRFGCKFCMFDKMGTTIKSKEALREELIYNYEQFGVTGYSLTDDTVNDSLEKMKMIHEVFTSLPFKVEWISYCRPDMFQRYPEMLDMMIESGCRGVFLGIETFNSKAAKIVGKGLDPNKIKDIVQWMKDRAGDEMFILGSFIIGLVGETADSLEDTLQYLIHQKCFDKILWEVLYLRPPDYRTEAKDDFNNNNDKYGIRKLQHSPYYWEHDTLNYNQCVDISERWKKELRKGNSGFNKALEENTNFFSYPRMRSLGYTHKESFDMLKYGNMPAELYLKNDQWIADYHKGLKSILEPPATNWSKPVVEVDYNFNMDILWQEYYRMKNGPQPKSEFYSEGKIKTNTLDGFAVYGSQEQGEDADSLLMQEAKRFCNYFEIEDDILAQFMWVDKDFNLSWHIDDATRCKSSVNVIMTEDPAPVTFREGDFYYKCAALDVMQEHAVFNKDKERVLMRISFRTLTHSELCKYFQ